VHLGVQAIDGTLRVWGTARTIPRHCLVAEVAEPGLLVVKHHRGDESAKFTNVAVLEGDRIKVVNERASVLHECPGLLSSLLGFDAARRGRRRTAGRLVGRTRAVPGESVLVQLAVSMRAHRHGGSLIVVPARSQRWRDSVVQPLTYAVTPAFRELSTLARHEPGTRGHRQWQDAVNRAVDGVAGLTAVDGATLITSTYDVLAFGVKIARRRGQPLVEQIVLTEPIEDNVPVVLAPAALGGTRHLSAAQFVHDQRDALALVASQDGHFTVFAWSRDESMVHAHRIETLLM
jgi:hypothetical protein